MTKTQLNRITIFIMNLWVNRVRQLALFAVALFFFSCTDEVNLLGHKNPNSKFDVKFIELPVASSVLLDQIRSSNFFYASEPQRLLVGKYSDTKFGNVSSSACSQFFTTTGTKLASTAQFMSVSLELRFDFYTYGASKTASTQEVSIYELDEELANNEKATYLNTKPILSKPELLGSKSFLVDPAKFQGYIDANNDTARILQIPLATPSGTAFGQAIFANAIKYRDATSKADSTFVNFTEFTKVFKGIAIIPNQCDKIIGFSPSAATSAIVVQYRTDSDTIQLRLSFTNTTGYNNIVSDKSGTQLAGLTQYQQDFRPLDDKRYIQSGTGIFTKLDIESFLKFGDTIPNMIINSAEIVVGDVEDGGSFDPPPALALRVLNENNTRYIYSKANKQAVSDNTLYKSFITPDVAGSPYGIAVDSDSTFAVTGDSPGYLFLGYSKSGKKYSGFLTRLLQQIYKKEEGKSQLRYFSLYHYSGAGNAWSSNPTKSVNRVVFPKDKIKLRIYYTVPTVKE